MSKTSTKATSLQKVLAFLLVLAIAGAAGGFYYGLQETRQYAVEVANTVKDAEASGKQIEELRQLQQTLAQADSLVQKANRIFTTEDAYQSQIVRDLQQYSETAGITITKTDFPAPTESFGGIGLAGDRLVVIGLAQPVSYSGLIRFLYLVEGSIPNMQPLEVSVARPDAVSGDTVTTGDITIRISLR